MVVNDIITLHGRENFAGFGLDLSKHVCVRVCICMRGCQAVHVNLCVSLKLGLSCNLYFQTFNVQQCSGKKKRKIILGCILRAWIVKRCQKIKIKKKSECPWQINDTSTYTDTRHAHCSTLVREINNTAVTNEISKLTHHLTGRQSEELQRVREVSAFITS